MGYGFRPELFETISQALVYSTTPALVGQNVTPRPLLCPRVRMLLNRLVAKAK